MTQHTSSSGRRRRRQLRSLRSLLVLSSLVTPHTFDLNRIKQATHKPPSSQTFVFLLYCTSLLLYSYLLVPENAPARRTYNNDIQEASSAAMARSLLLSLHPQWCHEAERGGGLASHTTQINERNYITYAGHFEKNLCKLQQMLQPFSTRLIQLGAPCELMKTVLGMWPEGTKTLSRYGELSLHLACLYHRPVETIQIILEAHPDAAAMKTQDGNLPIHLYLHLCTAWNENVHGKRNNSTEAANILLNAFSDAVKGDDGAKILTLVCRKINGMQVSTSSQGRQHHRGIRGNTRSGFWKILKVA